MVVIMDGGGRTKYLRLGSATSNISVPLINIKLNEELCFISVAKKLPRGAACLHEPVPETDLHPKVKGYQSVDVKTAFSGRREGDYCLLLKLLFNFQSVIVE